MKKLYVLGSLVLAGCNGSTDSSSSTTLTSSSVLSPASTTTTTSGTQTTTSDNTNVSMTQRYVYALIGGKVNNFPIDSTSGNLIIRTRGGVLNSVSMTIPSFYAMVIDPSGKYLYALDKVAGNYWIFAITDNYTYDSNSSDSALTYVANGVAGNGPDALSFGSNGHLYVRSSTTYANDFSQNVATGLLTYLSHTPSLTAAGVAASDSVNFSNIIQVGFDTQTYQLDTQTNTVIHYNNGVLSDSATGYTSGNITSLILK